MKKHTNLLVVMVLVIILAGCVPKAEEMPTAALPAGKAFADGKEIYFVHTEASEADIAELLTNMMDSPVLYTPGLADAPESALAEVYVFENGLEGKGPLGYQADVFDNPPGEDGYSPLRRLNVVSWADPTQARLLTSEEEILAASAVGEVSIQQPGVVLNMPFVVWEGGKR
jgi:hypothetical protein